jgi:1-acyl-sn-glycerol-3-phosphate acyltransferase
MVKRLVYIWRVFAKWLSFGIFGIGTILLVTVLFPLMRLVLHPRRRFQKNARALVSFSFRFFVGIMTLLGVVKLEPGGRSFYRNLRGKIVAANHPSLLDVVMLISLIPHADCIVRGGLSKTIVSGVIRQLYIPNDLNFEKLTADCTASLNEGNCIVIFPEGSRTPRTGSPVFKKGAVRISMASLCGIVPVHIGGTDKYGLGKKDPWTAFNPQNKYIYRLSRKAELSPEKYLAEPPALGVKHYNQELYRVLLNDGGETV